MLLIRSLIIFFSLVLSTGVFAQKVAGFYGDWHQKSELDRVQWDKLTDVYLYVDCWLQKFDIFCIYFILPIRSI